MGHIYVHKRNKNHKQHESITSLKTCYNAHVQVLHFLNPILYGMPLQRETRGRHFIRLLSNTIVSILQKTQYSIPPKIDKGK